MNERMNKWLRCTEHHPEARVKVQKVLVIRRDEAGTLEIKKAFWWHSSPNVESWSRDGGQRRGAAG